MIYKKIAASLCICVALLLCACSETIGMGGSTTRGAYTSETEAQLMPPTEGVTTAVFVTSMGTFKAFLFETDAPMACQNFIGLANNGYFNGISFHRVIKDFLVQSGDATGTGTGGSTIWNNNSFPVEVTDRLHHYSGALSMAHPQGDSLDNFSQFFVVATPQNSVGNDAQQTLTDAGVREGVVTGYAQVGGAPYLDNLNTVFGQIYSGMDVIDAIAAVATDENGKPTTDVILESVTIGRYSQAAEDAESAAAQSGTASSTVGSDAPVAP